MKDCLRSESAAAFARGECDGNQAAELNRKSR
jgi:hypothetical protein